MPSLTEPKNMDNPYANHLRAGDILTAARYPELGAEAPTLNSLFVNQARHAIEQEIVRLQKILAQL